jgi:hypothetical protein
MEADVGEVPLGSAAVERAGMLEAAGVTEAVPTSTALAPLDRAVEVGGVEPATS